MRDERLQKDAKVKAAKHLLQSPGVREERLQKDAKVKAAKSLLQSPEVREERLPTVLFFFFPFFTFMFDKRLPHQQNITIKLKMHTGYVLYYTLLLVIETLHNDRSKVKVENINRHYLHLHNLIISSD